MYRIRENPDTYCNPLNIGYQYQKTYFSRESADPACFIFQGEYYLFASHGSGYWHSKDLVHWEFICLDMDKEKEFARFAPATCVIGNYVYVSHSECGNVLRTSDPKSGKWEDLGKKLDWGDPAFLVDDDNRVYAYYNGVNSDILAVELDPDNGFCPIGEAVLCIVHHKPEHGFEVPGDYNTNYDGICYIEGAWMVKHDGKYYLQYAAPGTEFLTYADGCYVSDKPLGPFEYCSNSPVAFKASGFAAGVGHGCLMQDMNGNWWKFGTATISIHHIFERRLVMSPAAFKDGELVCNMLRGDYPAYVPNAPVNHFENPGPDWHLLSYNIKARASSTLDQHDASLAFNEDIRSWWSAKTGNAGEWIEADLGKICTLHAFQINFADQDVEESDGRDNEYCYRYLFEGSTDGKEWHILVDKSRAAGKRFDAVDTSHDYYELEEGSPIRYIRLTNQGPVPANSKFAVSGIRLFGDGNGKASHKVTKLQVARNPEDRREITLTWDKAEGAEGYFIRFGYRNDSLNISHQVIGATSVTLRCLNTDCPYYFEIDSYNDSGYTKGDITVLVE